MPLEVLQNGRYRRLRLLGVGGMGEVYLMEDTRVNRQVAIKVIRTEAGPYTDSNTARLFQREARAIAALDHPNILPLYDFGEEALGGAMLTYIVMPYCAEGSFADWLRKRGSTTLLSPQDVTSFITQAADALQYAHDRQVMHLDIKSANFLLRSNRKDPTHPTLLLADFGVSRLSSAATSSSRTVRGTPTSMAPEQWSSAPVPATDQYALAVMAYELLVGRPPFRGSMEQLMYQHFQEQPPAPSSINPRLARAVDAVLLRALAKRPQERFSSISAFADVLEKAVKTLPPEPAIRPAEPRPSEIRATLAISTTEAVAGTNRTLTLPGGRKVIVLVPPGAYDGQVIRLPNPGNPGSAASSPGVLILTLAVQPAEQARFAPDAEGAQQTMLTSSPNFQPLSTPVSEPNPPPTVLAPPPPAQSPTPVDSDPHLPSTVRASDPHLPPIIAPPPPPPHPATPAPSPAQSPTPVDSDPHLPSTVRASDPHLPPIIAPPPPPPRPATPAPSPAQSPTPASSDPHLPSTVRAPGPNLPPIIAPPSPSPRPATPAPSPAQSPTPASSDPHLPSTVRASDPHLPPIIAPSPPSPRPATPAPSPAQSPTPASSDPHLPSTVRASDHNLPPTIAPPPPPLVSRKIARPSHVNGRTILLIGLALLVIASGVGLYSVIHPNQVATANPNATATTIASNATGTTTARIDAVTATARAQATATASVIAANPDPYPPGGGKLALYDPLRDNSQGYGWVEGSTNTTGSACTFKGGAYHVLQSDPTVFNSYCIANSHNFSNFAYEVQMQIIQGDGGGIIFRANNTGANATFYLFTVDVTGHYEIFLCPPDNTRCQVLVTSTFSSAIKQGLNQTNIIAVVAQGSTMTLYVNHQQVRSFTDSTSNHGQIGVVAFPFFITGGHPTEVVYSNAKVWTF